MNTIAERIKFAMNVRNVKQVEMVQRTGITKGAFSSYLSGNYNPKKDKLELIADALDININWLMGENVPMENSNATDNQTTGYVFYKEMEYLLNDKDTAYIGFQTQYGALIPRYRIYVDVSLNEMHDRNRALDDNRDQIEYHALNPYTNYRSKTLLQESAIVTVFNSSTVD